MEIPKKIGRYEILEELGHGAMGTVYRAKDPAMDRVVALKTIISVMLASEQGTEFRERFYREARAAGGLAHPGIVPVFDVGEHEGSPFLVMEFVTGKTLSDTIRGGQRLTLDRVCEIGQKIAEALGYAHQHGVVHRDIKPANILLTSREVHGIERPKITDFGVAKMAAGNTTMTGQMIGTPAFMPPEQFTGSAVDGRADIFSLGVILYWMTTGEQPFPGESMTAVSYKVVHTEPVPPRKLNPSVPARLESAIMKCLSKSPEGRYQTAEELVRELGEMRTGTTSATLRTSTAQIPADTNDPEATLVDASPADRGSLFETTKMSARKTTTESQKKNSTTPVALIAVAAMIIVAGGWIFIRSRQKPPIPVAASIAPAAVAPVAAVPIGVAPTPPPVPPVTPAIASPAPAAAVAVTPPVKPTPPPLAAARPTVQPPKETQPKEPAGVNFDPKTLDPKENAKLKIEANPMPAGLDFVVEMNGEVYLQSTVTASGKKIQIEDLFVPPGVQEFRVRAKSGTLQKTSNAVSTEFKPKKKHTLKIELRTPASPSKANPPQVLGSDSQVVVSLQ